MPETPDSSTWSARLEGVEDADLAVGDRQQPVVGDDDEGVDLVAQRRRCRPRPASARRRPSKANGRVTTPIVSAPSERAMLRHDRRAAGAGAAALARGDEDHVGALEHLLDLLAVVLGRLPADLGVGAGAEAAGELAADVELDVGVAHQQRLRVGVDRDELDALETDLDHPVDGVDTASADADDLDDREVVLRCCHGVLSSFDKSPAPAGETCRPSSDRGSRGAATPNGLAGCGDVAGELHRRPASPGQGERGAVDALSITRPPSRLTLG